MFRKESKELVRTLLNMHSSGVAFDDLVTEVQDFLVDRDSELEGLRTLSTTVRHLMAEKLADVYFISGQLGSTDKSGLPDGLLVCPAYGADWSQVYKKTDTISGVEW